MKRAFYLLFIGLILPVALLLVFVGNGISSRLPARVEFQTVTPPPLSLEITSGGEPDQVTATPVSLPTPDPDRGEMFLPDLVPHGFAGSVCGSPDPQLLVLVGTDSRDDSYVYGLADVIRLVRVDYRARQLTVLALPRDLWVAIPGIADHYGITHGKINQAYLYGGEGMGYYDGPGGGPALLAWTLEKNYGIEVDRYLALNMATFVEVVDAMGGIDIELPEAVDGRPARGGSDDQFFLEGEQHLDGAAALRLARLRNNYDDLVRSQHQDLVMEALRAKLLSPALVPALPDLVDAFKRSILTDLQLADIAGLLCLAPHIGAENVIFAKIPPHMLELGREMSPQLGGSVSVFKADPEALGALLANFQAGKWP